MPIIIAGIDASITGTAIVKYVLDDDFDIIDSSYMAFCSTKKWAKDPVIFCKKEHFKSDLERFDCIGSTVSEFIYNCDYVAFEDYAFGAQGRVFQIGEFTGNLKLIAFKLGAKIQLYDPNSIKMFATCKGNADKMQMKIAYDAITNCDFKPALGMYPPVVTKKGVSPTSDIVDAFFICDMFHTELMLRKGLIALSTLGEATIRVFNRTTPAQPVNILGRDLIAKEVEC